MPALHKLSFHAGHIHIGRTFTFACFTTDAVVEGVVQLLGFKSIFLAALKKLTKQVGPTPGGIFFLFSGHIAGTHTAAAFSQLPANAGTVTERSEARRVGTERGA